MDPFDLAVLQVVARGGLMLDDQIADRLARENAEEIFGRNRSLSAALHRLEVKGYLERRPVVYSAAHARLGDPEDVALQIGSKVFDQAFYVTERAGTDFAMALPPTVRDSFVEHHIKTIDAAHQLEAQLRSEGATVVSFKTESELIRDEFRGKVFDGRGTVVPKFPDAVLTVRHANGVEESINVEYVSSKYTDQMIREKAAAFSGRTVWAASNSDTAGRVAALTGEEPLLV